MGAIYDKAAGYAANNILSVQEVGKLLGDVLADGKVTQTEKKDLQKIQEDLGEKLTGPARIALLRFQYLGDTFEPNLAGTIFGVDTAMGEKLEAAGVMTPLQLLGKAKLPSDRHAMATSFGMSLSKLEDVAERADLARTIGIGTTYAAVLEGVGVRNIQELANQDVSGLHAKIKEFKETEAGAALFSRVPSKGAVETWINRAAALPYMIQRTNEAELPFSKWAFDQLEDAMKATLLRGANVELPKNQGIFDASGTKSAAVAVDSSGLPAALKAALQDIEANPPSHPDFAGSGQDAEVTSLREIKVGEKTIGYTATVDVQGMHHMEYEGMPVDSELTSFEMSFAFDAEGKKLDEMATYW